MKHRWLVAALTLAMVLTACGGDGDSADATTTTAAGGATSEATTSSTTSTTSGEEGEPVAEVDPCSLLTAADLEAATGVAFGDGVYNESLSQDQQWICDWTATGSEFATAQVLIIPIPSVYESNKESAAEMLGDVEDVSIPGADAAYATADHSIIGMLVGDLFVQTAYLTTTGEDLTEAATEIATVVAGNV